MQAIRIRVLRSTTAAYVTFHCVPGRLLTLLKVGFDVAAGGVAANGQVRHPRLSNLLPC